jgi:uncharacterized protein (TIGR02646 family)
MEKINNRALVTTFSSLTVLATNYEKWGQEYKLHLDTKKKQGVGFSWRMYIYEPLKTELSILTQGHCTFCDGYPIGTESKETIEHFYPKNDFPLLAYKWENLFYCCDKCQSEANKRPFQYTLKPDDANYNFEDYFYFDLGSGKLLVLENLEKDNPAAFANANNFLLRYGINGNPKRNQARKDIFKDIKNHLKLADADDIRERNDFKYRYVYDFVKTYLSLI